MSNRPRRPLAILALALATLAAACGADSSTGPRAQQASLDQALSELSAPAVSSTDKTFGVGATALPALVRSSCTYQTESQSFDCTPIVAGGLTVTHSFTLLNASGAKQSAFGKTTTDAVRSNTTIAGTINNGGVTATVDGQRELTLSGLLGGTHTLNGTSTVHIASVDGGIPFSKTISTTISGLILPPRNADGTHPWPAAGTIVVESTTTVGADAPTPTVARVTITFSGSSTVTVTFTGAGIAGSCQIDLASEAPSCG